jgi:drug/metabolite transporter (DMT)-like permease
MKIKQEHIADFLLLSVTVFWGSTFVIVKKSIEIMPTFAFLSLRFWLASLVLCVMFFPKFKKLNKTVLIDGALLGLMLFLSYAFQTVALEYSKASVVGFLTGLNVVIVPILSAFVIKKMPRIYSQVGVFFALIGVALMSLNENFSISWGDSLAIICAFFISVHILMTDRFSRKYDTYLLTTIQITVLAILSTVVSIAKEPYLIPEHFDSYLIFSLIITSLFATVYAFIIQTTMQKYTTPTKTALIFTMEPVMAGVFGYLLAGEILPLRGYLGSIVIFLGILIAEFGYLIFEKRFKE